MLYLSKLESKLDKALSKETKESLTEWIGFKRKKPKTRTMETALQYPNELEPVLAKISHQNDLGRSQWYEVVFYVDGEWCSYAGSNTFENGESVIEWVSCYTAFNNVNK